MYDPRFRRARSGVACTRPLFLLLSKSKQRPPVSHCGATRFSTWRLQSAQQFLAGMEAHEPANKHGQGWSDALRRTGMQNQSHVSFRIRQCIA
ncbi:hypothetical protein BCR44DRAFT_1436087 [Catenaria anguillulae PL171]|uniref:Uncharacterized protein n=1 Tax=Catenaria anguillulae PL171 TaxID=765915 RepID=A0A1Y2HNB2_9FUNG|nr:hypothetical protein BCR44DRAFT_1436087 [Catenaria anguillulae PL171]